MSSYEDWLQDHLVKISKGSYKYRKLKNSTDKQNKSWQSFHFSTRLKLDGADHFCRQALGAASRPDGLGLPLLAHRQLEWYLDAFFFELMSAYDTLLQELNIVYANDLGLTVEQVRWPAIKDKLPETLLEYMDKERKEKWFRKLHQHRNRGAHHRQIPTSSWTVGWGDKPWHYAEHAINILYVDPDTEKLQVEKVNVCSDYLGEMVEHIYQVWQKMAPSFTKRPIK